MRYVNRNLPLLATLVVFCAAYATAAFLYDGFFSIRVAVNLLIDNAILGVVALGMTFVILSAGIDLSVGSVTALATVLVAVLVDHGCHPLLAMSAALAAGAVFGAGQGAIVEVSELPAFLVTLAGMFFARGLAFCVSETSVPIRHAFYRQLDHLAVPLTERVELPFTALVMLGVFASGIIVANATRFGRNVYAIGGNESSARLMGLPVGRTRIGVYALSGCCAALGGVLATCYMGSGNPTFGTGMELDAIAVVVIGGTLLRGGVGGLAGTLVGLLTYGTIQSALMFDGRLNSWWLRIVVGALLLAFVLLQRVLTRRIKLDTN